MKKEKKSVTAVRGRKFGLMVSLTVFILGAAVLTGCQKGAASANATETNPEKIELTNVSYDPTRELYESYNEAFAKYWKDKTGQEIEITQSKKQKSWLSDQAFAKKFGFEVVDTTDDGYELLALSFDGTTPKFTQKAKKQKIENKELTIYYDMQCPYVNQYIKMIQQYCEVNDVPVSFIHVDTLQKAKDLPCVFNNWGVFYKGNFETVNLIDTAYLKRILKK